MALTLDQVTAITKKKFLPKLYDNVYDSNALLQRSKSKGWYEKIAGGEKLVVPLGYASVTASGWYAGAQTLDVSDNQTITGAEYTYKQLYTNITIRRDEELKNSGEEQVVSLLKSKVQNAEKNMADLLGTGLYSDGSDSASIVGLRDIVAIDQSVGGISQTDNSWWRAKVDSTTTVVSMNALQTIYGQCTIDNEKPSVGITTRTIYDLYYALLQPQQRFQDDATAKGGFSSLMFNGCPIIADSHCPASNLFFLNEKHLILAAHKDEDMRMEDFIKPVNQNVKIAKIYWFGAMGSSNNRLHGRFSALAS